MTVLENNNEENFKKYLYGIYDKKVEDTTIEINFSIYVVNTDSNVMEICNQLQQKRISLVENMDTQKNFVYESLALSVKDTEV